MVSTETRTRSHKSRSTQEDRTLVYERLRAQPDQMIEADTPAEAWRQLELDKVMTVGVFKSALGHLVHPVQSQGERQLVSHSRQDQPMQTKSSRPSHFWRALAQPRD